MSSAAPSRTDERPERSGRTPIVRHRRSVLANFTTGLVVTLAGCLDSGGSEPAAGNGSTGTTTATGSDDTGSDDATTTGPGTDSADDAIGPSGDLDLREANVVAVEIERSESEYTFDVTVHHDVHES